MNKFIIQKTKRFSVFDYKINTTFIFQNDTIALISSDYEFTWSQYGYQINEPNILINFDHRIYELEYDISMNKLSFSQVICEICNCFDGLIHQLISYLKYSNVLPNLEPIDFSFFTTNKLKSIISHIENLKLVLAFKEKKLEREKWVEILRSVRSCLVHRGKYILLKDMESIFLMFPLLGEDKEKAVSKFIEKLICHLKSLYSFIKNSFI